jgi:SAM-dependent methyltransferase
LKHLSEHSTTEHLTHAGYWDRVWDGHSVSRPLDPNDRTLNNFMNLELHQFFQRVFRRIIPSNCEGIQLIELGCGGSTIPADIRLGDMFDPPHDMIGAFDVVFSSGLVEHFSPTTDVIEVSVRFCKPGGHLITLVPNLAGALGFLQRLLNKPVYDLHVPLSLDDLVQAHRDCGLDIVDFGLIGTVNFSVLNFSGPQSRVSPRIGLRLASWTSKIVWIMRRIGMPDMPNRLFSPYIACIAKKPS